MKMPFELALPSITILGNMAPEMRGIALAMYGLMGMSAGLFMLFFMTWWATRGWLKPLINAKLRGKSLLLHVSRDKKLKAEAVRNITGMYKSKVGEYMINPESVYHTPAGTPISIGYEHAGATLNPKHIYFLQTILKEGVPMVGEDGKESITRVENIEDLEAIAEQYKKQTGEDLIIKSDGETLRIQDILNFFKYDTNPSLMEAKIENKLAKERMEERRLPLKMFMAIIPFMLTLVVCAIILVNFINSQGSVQQLNQCSSRLATAEGQLTACQAKQPVVSTSGSTDGGETSLT